ncbi:type II toxin-antitoxin system RelE/ParE family toxin [Serratia plymuthica]|uniref:type II toxin-antitoxin system RelE/ParE family toxin n=1 Tax=Serratia plymuthica TaxID=82996 RepID=UPI0007EBF264|nr:type II toxin-antitoxin system RelE/ParE family toxin [Serratia plymuthica]ANJ96902.1 toxin RelE [Serratia plymuthica]MBI6138490.1 type II toxin-antitoxin system RelE/ParE family toxin [Serratia plymuthica]QPS85615.1 type II toxin-antitoxin system RelE/ParE family toxin [Serratia plymuthica]
MWTVITTEEFDRWFAVQDELTQEKVLAALVLLERSDPNLSRPFVDSLRGSQHPNMKELRVQHKGRPIRAFFAFDSLRQAIVLCAGDKTGNEKRFYKVMLPIADAQFTQHLMCNFKE